ncbi:MAG: CoA transferase [Dehalococcoidia bacterium]|nr:CoA transferase [Dehalococcoidia bacterium]
MTLPLEGYRVLDLTSWFQSVAPRMLGDLGAEVIKIEPRGTGEPMRGAMTQVRFEMGEVQRLPPMEHANFNKKDLSLDLTKAKGREVLWKLVEKSDVIVHNVRKKATKKLGIDYDTLSRHNPRLIYAVSTAWGSKGPSPDAPSYDRLVMARSGIMSIMGAPGTPPAYLNGAIADHMGATMTALGIVLAILKRERTGKGQEVEASLLGSMIHLLGMNVDHVTLINKEVPRHARTNTPNPFWNEYRCKDDKWLTLGMLQADRYWHPMCEILGLQHIEKDPRFEDIFVRKLHSAECIEILDEAFATRPRAEWLEMMGKEDIVVAPVNSFFDLMEDPQVWANDYIGEYEDPRFGKTRMTVTPLRFGDDVPSIRLPAPEYGEHTEMILNEILGMDWDEIIKLKEEEVI